MTSAMAAIAANARHRQLHATKEAILKRFASDSTSTHRATTKVVKMILLNGPYTFNDRLYEIKAKSLGAGVYELSTEKKEA